MRSEYGESYRRIFDAAFDAGVQAAHELSDAELRELTRYSGIAGLVAEHVLAGRAAQARKTG